MSTDPDTGQAPAWDELPSEKRNKIVELVDELEEIEDDPDASVTRREAVKALGALGLGAAIGGGSYRAMTQPAAAAHGGGTIGTAANPLSMVHTHDISDLESLYASGPLEVEGSGGVFSGTTEANFGLSSSVTGEDGFFAAQESDTGGNAVFMGTCYSDTVTSSGRFGGFRARNSVDAPAAVTANDRLAALAGSGYHTNGGWSEAGDVRIQAAADASGSVVPGEVRVRTRDSSDSYATRLKVGPDGKVDINSGILNGGGVVTDGDGTERNIWVIANGASDPAGATAEDIIFEKQ